MTLRLIVCTGVMSACVYSFQKFGHSGKRSHTKQVALTQRIWFDSRFQLAQRSCEPCDILMGLFLWPGVTASREAKDSPFSLAKTSRKVPISVNCGTVLWLETELKISQNWTQTTSYRDHIFPACPQPSGKRHLQVKLTGVLFLSCT